MGDHPVRTTEAGLDQEEPAAEEGLVAFQKQGVAAGDWLALVDKEWSAGSWAKERVRGEQEVVGVEALVGKVEEYPGEAGLVHGRPLAAAAVACDRGCHIG